MSNPIQVNFDTEDTTVPPSAVHVGPLISSGLTVTGPVLLGRADADSGAVQELNASDVLDFLGDLGIEWVMAPTNSTDSGTAGQAAYDDDYFYICTATDTWRRIPISDWS